MLHFQNQSTSKIYIYALLVPVKQEVIPTHNSFNKHLIIELSKSIIGETIFKNSKVIE